MQSHYEVLGLGLRTSTYVFWWDTIQPVTASSLLFLETYCDGVILLREKSLIAGAIQGHGERGILGKRSLYKPTETLVGLLHVLSQSAHFYHKAAYVLPKYLDRERALSSESQDWDLTGQLHRKQLCDLQKPSQPLCTLLFSSVECIDKICFAGPR